MRRAAEWQAESAKQKAGAMQIASPRPFEHLPSSESYDDFKVKNQGLERAEVVVRRMERV
jgi:hypothetical protein